MKIENHDLIMVSNKSTHQHLEQRLVAAQWIFLLKVFTFILIFSDSTNMLFAQDFRSVNWGMSIKQVVETESDDGKTRIVEIGENDLVFDIQLAGMAFRLTYFFEEGKLTSAQYERHKFAETFPDAREDEVEYMKNLLSQKYGEPFTKSDREEEWKRFLWESKDKSILLDFAYNEKEPRFLISYAPRK